MSIRDFDPLLKRAADRAARAQTPAPASPVPSGGRVSPIRLSVGRTHIRTSESGSAAELGRNLNRSFQELSSNLAWFTEQLDGVLVDDVVEALRPTFELSQEYVPVKTGDLKASGFLEAESFRGGARAVIGYGRAEDPFYAIFVHEIPASHEPPTSDKYLQKAVDEDYYKILQRITDRVRARFG